MKYKVLGRVYGERTYTVEADSYEEAIKKGKEADLEGKSDSEYEDIIWSAEEVEWCLNTLTKT